jgi:acetyl-CoA carboxylase carboxyl transferase subunit alpha
MKITADDMTRLGVIDQIIREPMGGAHRDAKATIQAVSEAVAAAFGPLRTMDRAEVRRDRQNKFLAIGRIQA